MANYHPKYLYEYQADLAMHTIKEQGIDAIPIIDENHMIRKVVFASNLPQEHGTFNIEIPVVIMAGGLGKRLSPYTNILPKPFNSHRRLSNI